MNGDNTQGWGGNKGVRKFHFPWASKSKKMANLQEPELGDYYDQIKKKTVLPFL